MNGVSPTSLLATQVQNTGLRSNSDSQSVGNKDFAAMLAEQFSDSDSALTGELSEADKKKELIMNLPMMMCQGGGSEAIMMSLLFAISGHSDSDAVAAMLGVSSTGLSGLVSDSSASATGKAVVDAAMTRLGAPYSTTYRGKGDYVDCSSLAQWAYKQAGIDLPGTSVKQAKYCFDNGYTISKAELQPGDLIFWSNTASTEGRWRQIHHVGIYAGNGKVIEAKGSAGGVVVDDIWGEDGSKWKIAMYARPRANASVAE
jgi:cell wall-associated NlpC family hydrolase